jgi:hypothetical protein
MVHLVLGQSITVQRRSTVRKYLSGSFLFFAWGCFAIFFPRLA